MAEDILFPWDMQLSFAEISGQPAKLQEELDKGKDANCRDFEHRRTFLSWAAEGGHEDSVKLLLERNAHVNELDTESGRTPLLQAVVNKHEATAARLLKAGASVDICDMQGKTPLMLAVRKGHGSLVKLLLDAGANPNIRDSRYGRTPLSWAAKKGYVEISKLLLDSNAALDLRDESGMTPIAWAASLGHEDMVRLLLERHANTETKDEDGRTPLSWAIMCGHDAIIRLLMEKLGDESWWVSAVWTAASTQGASEELDTLMKNAKIDLNSRDSKGRTLLMLAAMNTCPEQVEILLAQGSDPNLQDEAGMTALALTADQDYSDEPEEDSEEDSKSAKVVRLLLEKNAEVDIKCKKGRTPLAHAASRNLVAVVSLLLDKGAEVDSRDDTGWTPLLFACERGHLGVVSLLLEKGADPNVRDDSDWTPLLSSSHSGEKDVVSLLLQKGADPSCEDNNGRSSIDVATEENNLGAVKVLLANSAPFNESETGYQALMNAIQNEDEDESTDMDMIKLLLEKGADPYSNDYWEGSPLMLAAERGYKEIVALFLRSKTRQTEAEVRSHVRGALVTAIKEENDGVIKLLVDNSHFSREEGDTLDSVASEVSDWHDSLETPSLLRPYFPEG